MPFSIPGCTAPPLKRPITEQIVSSACRQHHEESRVAVAGLYRQYRALLANRGDPAAFQALLGAATTGDQWCTRLAARLVPRFLIAFPDEVLPAAAVLTQQLAPDMELKGVEAAARQDALQGLAVVLRAATSCQNAKRDEAVKLVLNVLLRLLPQAVSDSTAQLETEETEEGELSSPGKAVVSGQWVRSLLQNSIELHPVATLSHCLNCLAALANSQSRHRSILSEPEQQLLLGVRLWLHEHLLRNATPAAKNTPALDAAAPPAPSAATAAASCGGAQVGQQSRSCCLQDVLNTSQELQVWVVQQARGQATAVPEVRSVLEAVLQLLTPHQQAAAQVQAEPTPQSASWTAPSRGSKLWQQQQQQQQQCRLAPSVSSQGLASNGQELGSSVAQGVELLGSGSWPAPGPPAPEGQVSTTCLSGAAEQQRQFPAMPGAICRVEPCLLVSGLPADVSALDVAAALGSDEAWLMDNTTGSSSRHACVTYKGVLEAAKAYLRHNGAARFGQQHPPLELAFADAVPGFSCRASAVSAEPSAYVWASKQAVGDAESITDELREAGLQLSHVHRVNNAWEPGTLLQTPSASHAQEVVAYLIKKHPQLPSSRSSAAAAAAAAAMLAHGAKQEDQPAPLPPELPRHAGWPPPGRGAAAAAAADGQQQQQQVIPPLPPGPAPAGPRAAGMQLQQQQQQPVHPGAAVRASGCHDANGSGPGLGGFRRAHSMPTRGALQAGGGWRPSPQSPGLHNSREPWACQQQQQGRWGGPVPPVPQQVLRQPLLKPQQQLADRAAHGPPPTLPPVTPLHSGASPLQDTPAAGRGARPAFYSSNMHPQQQLQQPPSQHMSWQQQQHSTQQHLGGQAAMHHKPQQHQHNQGSLHAHVSTAAVPGGYAAMDGAPRPILWRGSIVKQQVRLCGVTCCDVGGHGSSSRMWGCASEPHCWPEELQVNYRILVADAIDQYTNSHPSQRAMRWLLPLDPAQGDGHKLQQFIDYLTGKERAGMVKLPGMSEQGYGPRALYLIVPTAQACQQLQVVNNNQGAALIAVVVPQLA